VPLGLIGVDPPCSSSRKYLPLFMSKLGKFVLTNICGEFESKSFLGRGFFIDAPSL